MGQAMPSQDPGLGIVSQQGRPTRTFSCHTPVNKVGALNCPPERSGARDYNGRNGTRDQVHRLEAPPRTGSWGHRY